MLNSKHVSPGSKKGKPWMERATFYKDKPGQEFYAALMAARAIGFDGFRSAAKDQSFPYPILFERGTADYEAAQREAMTFCRYYPRPIWRSPATRHHRRTVSSVAFSPDGRTLASGSYGTVKLWDLEKGGEPLTFTGNSSGGLAFRPNGRMLASSSQGKTIMVWDLEKGGKRRTLTDHEHKVHCVAFSPDGRTLASGSPDETIMLWDILKGGGPQTLTSHRGNVTIAQVWAFSPDGRTLASGGTDGTVKLWDLVKGGEPANLHREFRRRFGLQPQWPDACQCQWR